MVHDSLARVHPPKSCAGKTGKLNDEILRESMCRLYPSMWKCRQRDDGNGSRHISQFSPFDRGYQTILHGDTYKEQSKLFTQMMDYDVKYRDPIIHGKWSTHQRFSNTGTTVPGAPQGDSLGFCMY